jgi:alpha-tubulin suppressor-like RCC1 family protein
VAAGPRHSLAVTSEGAVYSWGVSKEGTLGHGAEEGWRWGYFFSDAVETTPRLVRELAGSGRRGVSVHAGMMHSACVDDAGMAHVWGQGRFNQLGLGADARAQYITEPASVPGTGRVSALSCGGNFTLALTRNGSILSWVGCRVRGAGCGVQVIRGESCWGQGAGNVGRGVGYRVRLAGCGVQGAGFKASGLSVQSLKLNIRTLGVRVRASRLLLI